MAKIRPSDFVLRCYGYKSGNGPYIGVCVDLNLAVQADTPDKVRKKMKDAIIGFINTVLDTNDEQSIPLLMNRKAPLHDWVIYYLIKCVIIIRQIPTNFIFKEYIPFHLAHSC